MTINSRAEKTRQTRANAISFSSVIPRYCHSKTVDLKQENGLKSDGKQRHRQEVKDESKQLKKRNEARFEVHVCER